MNIYARRHIKTNAKSVVQGKNVIIVKTCIFVLIVKRHIYVNMDMKLVHVSNVGAAKFANITR
jgi:hypothetical protein